MVKMEGDVDREDAEDIVEVLEHHEDGAAATTGDAVKDSGVTSDAFADTPEGAKGHGVWCGSAEGLSTCQPRWLRHNLSQGWRRRWKAQK